MNLLRQLQQRRPAAAVLACCLLGLLTGCAQEDPVSIASGSPARLSDWNLYSLEQAVLRPNPASEVYLPANQLFTDYAHKLRTLWIPAGQQARLVNGEIDYPPGTVLSKTFYYPKDPQGRFLKTADKGAMEVDTATHHLVETRVLVRREAGWEAFPYVWNEQQTEAFLRVAGATRPITLMDGSQSRDFLYFVPNGNQCSGCHTTEHPAGDMHPLGAIARQLQAARQHGDQSTQIERLVARGWLDVAPTGPAPVSWQDETATLAQRAPAYLAMHCGHCHNPDGAADTSGLILDGSHQLAVSMGVCKPPVAAGGGAGDLRYSIVPGNAEQSILLYRMQSEKPDEMMPELGRSLVHREGIELVRDWINAMPGACGVGD